MQYWVKDSEFKKIMEALRQIKRLHTKDEDRLRRFIEAVWYMCRSGCQWRLLPSYYGNWRSVHKRFKRWSDYDIWKKLFELLKDAPDMEWIMIDSTIVRSHACSAGYKKNSADQEALGRSRGGFSTKIHSLVDALGLPLKFILTPGQRNDITQAVCLTEGIRNSSCIADKGYDSDAFILELRTNMCDSIIPSKINRKNPRNYDEYLYKERNLIERFFSKIKHFRRIFSRFDKCAHSYLSFIYFVGALIWIR